MLITREFLTLSFPLFTQFKGHPYKNRKLSPRILYCCINTNAVDLLSLNVQNVNSPTQIELLSEREGTLNAQPISEGTF